MTGELMITQTSTTRSTIINNSGWPKGVYVVKVNVGKQLWSEKAHSTTERLLQKPIEWVIAVKLERNYTKDEILDMIWEHLENYFNSMDDGMVMLGTNLADAGINWK